LGIPSITHINSTSIKATIAIQKRQELEVHTTKMVKFISIIIACSLAVFVTAHFGGGRGGHKGGPLGAIFGNLTTEQQQEVGQIFRNSTNDTKAEIKAKIDAFAQGLDSNLQVSLYTSVLLDFILTITIF
jgi:hypothetical protein